MGEGKRTTRSSMGNRGGDRALAVCTIGGAAIYLYADSRLPQLQIGDPMGPQVFPALIGIGLLGSGLLLVAETMRKPAGGLPALATEPTEPQFRLVLACMAAWTALYYVAFEPVGYIVSTLVYMFALFAYFNRGRWLVN